MYNTHAGSTQQMDEPFEFQICAFLRASIQFAIHFPLNLRRNMQFKKSHFVIKKEMSKENLFILIKIGNPAELIVVKNEW